MVTILLRRAGTRLHLTDGQMSRLTGVQLGWGEMPRFPPRSPRYSATGPSGGRSPNRGQLQARLAWRKRLASGSASGSDRESIACAATHGSKKERAWPFGSVHDDPGLTAYDWLLARRTAALGIALSALLLGVTIATDEAGSSWAERLGKLSALMGLAGGGAALLATEQARSRGELRALAIAGVRPLRASLGSLVGGGAIGALGPALILSGRSDPQQLFPRAVPEAGNWSSTGDTWVEAARGIVVRANGALEKIGPSSLAPARAMEPPEVAIVVTLIVAALAFPVWATARGGLARRAAVALSVGLGSVVIFHFVAAGRAAPMWLVVPPFVLLADAWALHRGGAWS